MRGAVVAGASVVAIVVAIGSVAGGSDELGASVEEGANGLLLRFEA